jgi:nucleoside 2-deoxyribosyltransferase
MKKPEDFTLYFASPFFNPEQIEREERLIAHLRSLGFKVFSPKENCNLGATAGLEDQDRVFSENCNAIRECDAIFAVTDTKDVGTIWEAGFGFGIGTPIIYYAETLGNRGFNLMLARSGKLVYQSQDDISYSEICMMIELGATKDYQGEIE